MLFWNFGVYFCAQPVGPPSLAEIKLFIMDFLRPFRITLQCTTKELRCIRAHCPSTTHSHWRTQKQEATTEDQFTRKQKIMSSKAKKGEEEETTQQVKLAKVSEPPPIVRGWCGVGRTTPFWWKGIRVPKATRELVAGALVAPRTFSLCIRENSMWPGAVVSHRYGAWDNTRVQHEGKRLPTPDVTSSRPAHRPNPTQSLSNHWQPTNLNFQQCAPTGW